MNQFAGPTLQSSTITYKAQQDILLTCRLLIKKFSVLFVEPFTPVKSVASVLGVIASASLSAMMQSREILSCATLLSLYTEKQLVMKKP